MQPVAPASLIDRLVEAMRELDLPRAGGRDVTGRKREKRVAEGEGVGGGEGTGGAGLGGGRQSQENAEGRMQNAERSPHSISAFCLLHSAFVSHSALL